MTLTAEGFARLTHVPRETMARLEDYVRLLSAWNNRINLVGRNTLGDVWQRHILDSAQILPHIPPGINGAIDLGSGAGLPGLILGILGVANIHLVESDRRKSVFLAEAIRLTGTPVTLHVRRAEEMVPFPVDLVTARACANLNELLSLAQPFIGPRTVCLLHKGRDVANELTQAVKDWTMRVETLPSVTDKAGCILKLEGVARVERR